MLSDKKKTPADSVPYTEKEKMGQIVPNTYAQLIFSLVELMQH